MVPPADFVASVLAGADEAAVREYSREIEELLAIPHLLEMNEKTLETCERWDDFCARFFHAYQDLALAQAEAAADSAQQILKDKEPVGG